MNTTPIAMAALAGLTTAAAAQTVGAVTLTASAVTVPNIGDTFTIGVVVSDNIAGNSVFPAPSSLLPLALALPLASRRRR